MYVRRVDRRILHLSLSTNIAWRNWLFQKRSHYEDLGFTPTGVRTKRTLNARQFHEFKYKEIIRRVYMV